MSKKRRKKKHPPPRRLRMKREARLQLARHWLPTYSGKNLVRRYARRFGVDRLCAVKELRMLGVEVSAEYEAQLRLTEKEQARKRRKRKEAREAAEHELANEWPFESDDYHAVIIGYTSAGFSYGVTWEDWDRLVDDDPSLPRRP